MPAELRQSNLVVIFQEDFSENFPIKHPPEIMWLHIWTAASRSLPVAGTPSVHYLWSNDDITFAVATNSLFTHNEPVNIVQVVQTPRNDKPEPVEDQEMDIDLPDPIEIKVGDFCLVKFCTNKSENKVFLGQCTDKHTNKNEKVVKFAFLRAKDSEKKRVRL